MSSQDSETFAIEKMHAAHRQLNAAIRMHFNFDDPVVVITLAGAASVIFSDLIVHRNPEKSWDRQAANVMNMKTEEYFRVMRIAQKFFKNADQDPNEVLQWEIADTEALIMATIMNAAQLDEPSTSESVFQLWYIAKHRSIFADAFEPARRAAERFPDLERMTPTQQRELGARVLYKQWAER
jgi:hypothetical protein